MITIEDGEAGAWLEAVGAAIDELVFVTAADGRMLWANAALERLTGYTVDDFQFPQRDNPFVHPDDVARVTAVIDEFTRSTRDHSEPIENRFFDRWGVVHAYRSTMVRVTAAGAPAILYVCHRLPEVAADDAGIEASFRALVEQAHDPILKLAADGRFLYFSPRFAALVGCTARELAGKGLLDVVADREAARAALARGGAFAVELVDKAGVRHTCEVTAGPLGHGHVIAVVRDVSEARRRDEELRQAQKMEAIGRLAGGVAHDFNNMLSAIRAYVELLMRQRAADRPLVQDLAQIGLAAERAARLTAQLLAFSKRQVLAPTLVDLADVAQTMASMLRQLIGETFDLRVATAPCGAVRADRGQLEQVVLNLVVNSRDAMPRGGTIDLSVAEVEREGARFARLSVVDQGTGMTVSDITRAAEPFFTTRLEGTGLGLSMVHGIVHQSGGHLAIDSAPGAGTRIDVFLPVIADAAPVPTPPRTREHAPPRPAVILLVEDERLVRESIRRLLDHLGYTVVAAESPGEALGYCRETDGAIDLLLTDFAMPGMNGVELGARIRKLRPACRVVVMSGYAASGDAAAADVQFLPKPFTVDALADAMRAALERVI